MDSHRVSAKLNAYITKNNLNHHGFKEKTNRPYDHGILSKKHQAMRTVSKLSEANKHRQLTCQEKNTLDNLWKRLLGRDVIDWFSD